MKRYQLTDMRTGELLDLSALGRPLRATRYSRPVRRYYRQPAPLEDLALGLVGVFAAAVALSVPFLN